MLTQAEILQLIGQQQAEIYDLRLQALRLQEQVEALRAQHSTAKAPVK